MSSKLWFSVFKKFVTRSVLGSSKSRRYHWILKLLVSTQKSDVWEQNCLRLFYYFNFERSYDAFKPKSPWILLKMNINFNETKRNRKWKIPHIVLERQTLCFGSYGVFFFLEENRVFFVPSILPKRNFLKLCLLSQCIVYWILFQNIHTFTYQKHYFTHFYCLFLKLLKAFSVSLIF